MPVSVNDSLVGPSRGTVQQAIDWAVQNKAVGPYAEYIREVYRLAPLVGLDALLVVAQSSEETDRWGAASVWWTQRTNPAGIGVTGDPAQNQASPTFASGTAAARAQIAHLLAYVGDPTLLTTAAVSVWRPLGLDQQLSAYDPRFAAVANAGLWGSVKVLGDLGSGKWAADRNYAANIVIHANAILAMPIATTAGEGAMTYTPLPVRKFIIPASLPNRPGGKLDLSRGPLHVTIHETANYNAIATAKFHATVWQTSADAIGKQVAVHLYVGEDAIYQCLPLDEIGWHAGDGCNDPATDVGCFRSVAIEKDVSAGTNPALVNKNLAICMSMIAAGDPSFDWGSGATRGKFDTEHYDQHIWVSQETPPHDCPYDIRHVVHPPMDWNWLMAQVDVYYPQVVAYLKGITPAPAPQPKPKPTPDLSKLPVPGIPLPQGVTTAYLKRRFAGSDAGVVTVDGTQYQFDANDPLSRAWLRKCLASIPDGKGYEDGQFPALTGAVKRAGTPNNKQGIDFLFSNGTTVPVYDQSGGK